jgi:hypothetical protein
MMKPDGSARPAFCDDAMLGYERSRTTFAPGAALMLDETYRLAHLPLLAPDHPGVIARRDGTDYEFGRHARIFSLVLPVDDARLRASPAFRTLENDLRASPFAGKIAWDLLPRRRERLHATLCGSLGVGEAPEITAEQRRALAAVGPVAVQLRGLFSGAINRGRLYLRAYPELRDGQNLFHAIQTALGRPTTELYLVGLYNLIDDLDMAETAALAALIERHWATLLLSYEANALWLLGSCDDLVLDAAVEAVVPLHSGSAQRPAATQP